MQAYFFIRDAATFIIFLPLFKLFYFKCVLMVINYFFALLIIKTYRS